MERAEIVHLCQYCDDVVLTLLCRILFVDVSEDCVMNVCFNDNSYAYA